MRFILDALARTAARSEANEAGQEDHTAHLREHEAWQRASETRTVQIGANLQTATNLIGRLAAAELLLDERMREARARRSALIEAAGRRIRRRGQKP